MAYRHVPISTPSERPQRQNRAVMAKIFAVTLSILTVITFVAFIFHGGIFLIVPAMIIYKLFAPRRTHRVNRSVQQREYSRTTFDPRNPYDNL